jgi:hypothetical protein
MWPRTNRSPSDDLPPAGDGGPGVDVVAATDAPSDVRPADVPVPLRARRSATEGGPLALTEDDAVLVAANRMAGTVAVFDIAWGADGPTPTRRASLPFTDGEPWAVVLGNDGDTAYVVLRRAQELVEVRGLRGTPSVGRRVRVGSEPTGVAISPTGQRLYVANHADGTVSEVEAAGMTLLRTVDLNAQLTSRLGPAAEARPGLAHPRGIAVTNDGDTVDGDETVFVTEFFGQPRLDTPGGTVGVDVAREGLVYRFNAGSGVLATPVTLPPLEDSGFVDAEGLGTGCFPSQLQGVTLRGGRLYVPTVCASPRGPTGPGTESSRADANFRTQVHAVVYAVDVEMGAEVPRARALLTRELDAHYTRTMTSDDGARRMPLIPVSVAFAPSDGTALVTAYGADALFRVRYGRRRRARRGRRPGGRGLRRPPRHRRQRRLAPRGRGLRRPGHARLRAQRGQRDALGGEPHGAQRDPHGPRGRSTLRRAPGPRGPGATALRHGPGALVPARPGLEQL